METLKIKSDERSVPESAECKGNIILRNTEQEVLVDKEFTDT